MDERVTTCKEKMEKCAERYFFSKSNDLNDDISS